MSVGRKLRTEAWAGGMGLGIFCLRDNTGLMEVAELVHREGEAERRQWTWLAAWTEDG